MEEQTLEQIMQKLARWYDITVFYQNPALKNKVFKGSVPQYAELQQVLNILEKTGEVQFHIQNQRSLSRNRYKKENRQDSPLDADIRWSRCLCLILISYKSMKKIEIWVIPVGLDYPKNCW